MAIDLQSLLAPPPVLQQNMNTALPNTSYGAPSIMDHLKSAFQADPQGMTNVATKDPGVIGGFLPQGSGVQNFLGRLGDAFLIANGKEPIHRQFAQQQAEGSAESPMLLNGAFNPDGSISDAAHQSLAALAKVNPEAAQKMQGQLISSQLARAQLQRETNVSNADIAEKNATVQDKALGAARALILASNPQNYPAMKARAEQLLKQRNVDPALLGAPDSFDAETVKSIGMAGVPVTRTFQMDERSQHDRALEDIGQQNARAHLQIAGAQGASSGARVTDAGTGQGSLAERIRHDHEMEMIEQSKGHNHHVFGGAPAASNGPANMGPVNAQSSAISQARAAIAAGAPRAAVIQRLQQMKINPAGL